MEMRYRSGKENLAWEARPTVLPNHLYPDIWLKEKVIKKMERLKGQEPWLIWVSFVGPHEPFDTPAPWRGYHQSKKLEKAYKANSWYEELDEDVELKRSHSRWIGKLSDKQIREIREDYSDHMKLLDDMVGEIVEKLVEIDCAHNTGILITSDHGEMLGDGGMLYKGNFLEPAVKVPFIYLERLDNKEGKECEWKKPIGLTSLFNKVLKSYREENSTQILQNWCRRKKGAIVEFGKERAFVQNGKKVVLNRDGKLLWATKPSIDRKEEHNYAKENIINTAEWKNILSWAKKHNVIRNMQLATRKDYS